MTDCCAEFSNITTSATRDGNPLFRSLDDCGDKTIYLGVAPNQYRDRMPVKFGPAPNTVVPALNGVGAIGFANSDLLAAASPALNTLSVTRTGHIFWKDVAAAIGALPTSQAEWWPIHQELAKANIYVEFS